MTARRKKPLRKTEWKPWDDTYARAFSVPSNWTLPSRIRVVTGRASGTITAKFKDEHGTPVEGFIRFRARCGEWEIVDSGLRMVMSFTVKGRAK